MKKFIYPVLNLIDELVRMAGNPAIAFSLQHLSDDIKNIVTFSAELAAVFSDLGTIMHGMVTFNWGEITSGRDKVWADIKKYESEGSILRKIAPPAPLPAGVTAAIESAETAVGKAQAKLVTDKERGVTEEQIAKDKAELQAAIKALEAAKKLTEQTNLQSTALTYATTSLTIMDAAVRSVTAALSQMVVPGMFGGAMTGASGPNVTEYGPGVAGDQPGGATYDYNSYHRIGAWPNITGPLRPGDVALGVGAKAHYPVQPGHTS
jgi:hypothetical protein